MITKENPWNITAYCKSKPQCVFMSELIGKALVHVNLHGNSCTSMHESITFAVGWMSLEGTMLNEASQAQKGPAQAPLYVDVSGNQIYRDREQMDE